MSDSSPTPWTVAYQAPPSMGFSRQEYWSGLLFPSPGDSPDPWRPLSNLTAVPPRGDCYVNGGALTERFDVGSSPAPTWHIVLGLSPSVVSDSATPWTVARQAPLSMGFSRQEYWSGLPFPSPEDLPDPGIEPRSPTL